MTWMTDSRLTGIDTESTGTNPETARIVSACVGSSSWLIDPGVDIPAEATAVHGVTTEHAREYGSDPAEALTEIYELLLRRAGPIVLHNAPYDLTLLDREFRRHLGMRLPDGLIVLDTLILYWRFDWRTGGRTLGKLAARHGIEFPAHNAEADARAAVDLLRILGDENDLLGLIEPRSLHEAQAGWWATRQDQLAARAQGYGHAFTPQPHWPLIPYQEAS